jgi:hypothetical protein
MLTGNGVTNIKWSGVPGHWTVLVRLGD